MKLAVALVASVIANSNKKFGKNKKKPEKGVTRSTPESCVATFAQLSAAFTPTTSFQTSPSLDAVNSGTSGHIDIHNYADDTNCFIEVVADESCQEITAEIVHAGLEQCGDGCGCDKFWFNNESTPDYGSDGGLCGCGGSNENPADGDGCNDYYYDNDSYRWTDDDYWKEIGDWEKRVFSDNKFVFNFKSDGSVAQGNVRIEWKCTKQAPSGPQNPEELLRQLVDWSAEMLNNNFASFKRKQQWIQKFERNSQRMSNSFKRCGTQDISEVDAHSVWVSYDTNNPSNAIANITTAFSKWSDAYLADCGGQKRNNYHKNRMSKWNDRLQAIHSKL